jgi:hypothetical protein
MKKIFGLSFLIVVIFAFWLRARFGSFLSWYIKWEGGAGESLAFDIRS